MYKVLTLFLLVFFSCSFQPKEPPKALVVGDSCSKFDGGWQDLLKEEYDVTNRSVGGIRTKELREVLMKEDQLYDYVFIYVGINDAFAYTDLYDCVVYQQQMVDFCLSRGEIPVIVVGYSWRANIRTWVVDKNREEFHRNRYRILQEQLEECLQDCYIVTACDFNRSMLMKDGIHPTFPGHRVLWEHIRSSVP